MVDARSMHELELLAGSEPPTSLVGLLRIAEERSADRTVLEADGRCWSYAELFGAADRLAAAILDAVGPGAKPVLLAATTGSSLYIGVLGILKAG